MLKPLVFLQRGSPYLAVTDESLKPLNDQRGIQNKHFSSLHPDWETVAISANNGLLLLCFFFFYNQINCSHPQHPLKRDLHAQLGFTGLTDIISCLKAKIQDFLVISTLDKNLEIKFFPKAGMFDF